MKQKEKMQMCEKTEIQKILEDPEKLRELISELQKVLRTISAKDDHNKREKTPEEEMRDLIVYNLLQVGIPSHISGYAYLEEAIYMLVKNPNIIQATHKEVYPPIAKKFNTTSSRVERAIRHAVEAGCNRISFEEIEAVFGKTYSTKSGYPSNKLFMARLADKIRREVR